MTQLRRQRSEVAQQRAVLVRFFQVNSISGPLGRAIWRYLWRNHFMHTQHMHLQDVEVFNKISPDLLTSLRDELYLPIIGRAPFMKSYGVASIEGVRNVCK